MGSNCNNIPIFIKNETSFDMTRSNNLMTFKNNYVGCGLSAEKPYGTFESMFAYRVNSKNSCCQSSQDLFWEETYKSPKCHVLDCKLESRTRFFINDISDKNGPEYKLNERLCLAKSDDLNNGFGIYEKVGVSFDANLNSKNNSSNTKLKVTPACLLGIEKSVFNTEKGGQFKMYLEAFPFDKSVVTGMKFTF